MPTVMITGANRGLGLEFAQQYAADGWDVIAPTELAIRLKPNVLASQQRKMIALSSTLGSIAGNDMGGLTPPIAAQRPRSMPRGARSASIGKTAG